MEVLAARLERSQHVFLLGLVVAFAVEIIVDWNSTFYEINVLRAQLGNKAMNQAAVLRLALEDVIANGDVARTRALAERVCEDPEVAGVHIAGANGEAVAGAGFSLPIEFPRQIRRDVTAMLADPDRFRALQSQSRHRDVFQSITDSEDGLLRSVLPAGWMAPAPVPAHAQRLALQDRIYEEKSGEKRDEHGILWALGVVDGPGDAERPSGVVVVALKTDSLRAAIRKKLLKGLLITLFFLGVILVQQLSARRDKMRMLSFRDALAAAREALAAALPSSVPAVGGMDGGLAFEQAERLGGTLFDLRASANGSALEVFVALPEGTGVDVAFASIYLRDEHRRIRRENPAATPLERLGAIAAAYGESPIHRKVQAAIFSVDSAAGLVRGVLSGMEPPTVLDEHGAALSAIVTPVAASTDSSTFGAPLQPFEIPFPAGALLFIHDDGLPAGAHHPLPHADVVHRITELRNRPASEIAEDLRQHTRKRAATLTDDLFVLVLKRDRLVA